MPIPYTCPHCGSQTSVDERYAGQTGPCAQCGNSITIPMPAGYTPTSAVVQTKSGGSAALIVFLVIGVLFILALCVGGLFIGLLLPAVQQARVAAQRANSQNNLKQIGLALHNYHSSYGSFPPAYLADASGQPLVSWRVLILPFLEQPMMFQQYDQSAAWDAPSNSLVTNSAMPTYRSANDSNPAINETSYVAITGVDAFFDGATVRSFAEVPDGLANTAIIVEVQNSGIPWTKPQDMTLDELLAHPGASISGYSVLFMDGSVKTIKLSEMPEDQRKAMFTRSGGEVTYFQ